MDRVSIIVPFYPASESRRKAWQEVQSHLSQYSIIEVNGFMTPNGYNKAAAIKSVDPSILEEVVVVHDSDVFCDTLPLAIEAIVNGVNYAIPHNVVRYLNRRATARIYDGLELEPLSWEEYPATKGGGIVVMKKNIFIDNPPDDRFVGWGREDDAWHLSLRKYGLWHGDGILYHLTHRANRIASEDNENLLREYECVKS